MDISICERMCPFQRRHQRKMICVTSEEKDKKEDALNFSLHHNLDEDALEVWLCDGRHSCNRCLEAPVKREDGYRIIEDMLRYGLKRDFISGFFDFEKHGRGCPIYVERLLEEWKKNERRGQ